MGGRGGHIIPIQPSPTRSMKRLPRRSTAPPSTHWVWLPSLSLQLRLGRTDAAHLRIVTDQRVVVSSCSSCIGFGSCERGESGRHYRLLRCVGSGEDPEGQHTGGQGEADQLLQPRPLHQPGGQGAVASSLVLYSRWFPSKEFENIDVIALLFRSY